MIGSGLKTELWRFGALLCFCLVAGWIFAMPAFFVAVGSIFYVLRLFWLVHRLEQWSSQARRLNKPPKTELKSLWVEVGYNIERIFARHNVQKTRLRKVVKRVQKMASALGDGVILLDKDENIEWWNGAAERAFGLKKRDAGLKLVNFVRHPTFVRYFELKDYSKPLELDMWQSKQHLEIQVHPFGKGEYLVVIRDITRLYRLELMRKDFVANVSHELRTPLTVIRGYVETLGDCDMPSAWAKAFKQMEQQCLRMDVLISDLIVLSKLETGEIATAEVVEVCGLLRVILDELKPLIGDKNLIVNCEPRVEIAGSERELRSALSNLVVNAINYSNEGADIIIDCEDREREVVIKVIDSGIGIDTIHLSRLTERFYRVDSSRTVATGGTGLGLAIVKHVLLRHKAELKIESTLGVGSTFACHFPKGNI